LSNRIGILVPQTFFLTIILSIFFLSRLFILSGCGMVGKICDGKKNLSLNCQALVRVLARNFFEIFDGGTPHWARVDRIGILFFFDCKVILEDFLPIGKKIENFRELQWGKRLLLSRHLLRSQGLVIFYMVLFLGESGNRIKWTYITIVILSFITLKRDREVWKSTNILRVIDISTINFSSPTGSPP
jgi:hypothetical protein